MSDDPESLPPFLANTTWTWKNRTEWREKAVAAQNDFYTKNGGIMFNKMKNYEDIETEILVKAFATNPKTVRTLASSMNMWYSKPERKIAIKMRTKIQSHSKSESVKMNAVYIMSYLKEGQNTAVPVFYFEAADKSVKYIDLTARVYKNWDDFVYSNVIDPSLCCYPVNGHYGQTQKDKTPSFNDKIPLKLFIAESPSCGILATGMRWTKTFFTYTTYIVMAASVVLTAGSSLSKAKWVTKLNAIAQKSNKYLQYANSAATIAISMVNIHDKYSHGEEIVAEISLIVSNVVSLLTPALQKRIITSGLNGKDLAEAGFSDLSPMAKMFLFILSASRCASACISVICCIGTMLYKFLYGGTITANDYFNLASSLYTCYGAVTSPLTAKKVFEQVQNEYKMEVARSAKKEAALAAGAAAVATGVAAAATAGAAVDATTDGDKSSESAKATGDSNNAANDTHSRKEASNAVAKGTESNTTTDKSGETAPGSGAGGAGDPEKPTNPNNAHYGEETEESAAEGVRDSAQPVNASGSGSAGNAKTPKNVDRNHDEIYKELGLRKTTPPTEEEKIAKKAEREQLEAEFQEKYKDDEEAKAGFEYYKSNILAGLDGNDYVVNDQLVRLIKAADDPKELFCELAFTNTTITIKRDVLLINGQLNVDGAAFSAHTNHGTTDIGRRLLEKIQAEKDGYEYVESGTNISCRERLLHTTAHLNGQDTPLPPSDIEQVKKDIKKEYRWTLESDVTAFEGFLQKNGITLRDNLTITHYNRLIQIYRDNQQVEKWKVVAKLVEKLGCDNPHAIAGLMEMVNAKVYHEYNAEEEQYQQAQKAKKLLKLQQRQGSPPPSSGSNKPKSVPKPSRQTVITQKVNNLLDGLNNDNDDATEFVNTIKENVEHYKSRYENGDPSIKNFNEIAAIEGPEAAAYEAKGHIDKKYETYGGSTDKQKFSEDYLGKVRHDGLVYSQDGRSWKELTIDMSNQTPPTNHSNLPATIQGENAPAPTQAGNVQPPTTAPTQVSNVSLPAQDNNASVPAEDDSTLPTKQVDNAPAPPKSN